MQILLLASHLKTKGAQRAAALSEHAAAALHTGAGESINPKLWPCEDSVALIDLGEGHHLAGVADAHWGGRIGEALLEPLRATWAETNGAVQARLQQTLFKLEAQALAGKAPGDDSETTLLLAHVAPDRVSWVSVGDSLLLIAEGGAAARQNQLSGVFLGGAPLAALGLATAGSRNLRPGQVVLLATDGLEPEASNLTAEQVGAHLDGEGPLESRLLALLAAAADPLRGGGRDNLGLVAVAV